MKYTLIIIIGLISTQFCFAQNCKSFKDLVLASTEGDYKSINAAQADQAMKLCLLGIQHKGQNFEKCWSNLEQRPFVKTIKTHGLMHDKTWRIAKRFKLSKRLIQYRKSANFHLYTKDSLETRELDLEKKKNSLNIEVTETAIELKEAQLDVITSETAMHYLAEMAGLKFQNGITDSCLQIARTVYDPSKSLEEVAEVIKNCNSCREKNFESDKANFLETIKKRNAEKACIESIKEEEIKNIDDLTAAAMKFIKCSK